MADDKPEDQAPAAKSAEDRKAASALANLDAAAAADDASSSNVDQDAVSKAMKSLGGPSSSSTAASAAAAAAAASSSCSSSSSAPVKKNIKVDPADVALLVAQLDLPRPKATELLKARDGDAVLALRAYARA